MILAIFASVRFDGWEFRLCPRFGSVYPRFKLVTGKPWTALRETHTQKTEFFRRVLHSAAQEGALDPSDRLYNPADTKTLPCGGTARGGRTRKTRKRRSRRKGGREIMSAIDVKRAKKDGRYR